MYVISQKNNLAEQIAVILNHDSIKTNNTFIKALSINDDLVKKTSQFVKDIYTECIEFIKYVFISLNIVSSRESKLGTIDPSDITVNSIKGVTEDEDEEIVNFVNFVNNKKIY